MAQRRMFSPDIVCSEEFLDMPSTSRELYFQLGMRADDDGFIQPKIIMRLIGASSDDLKVLLSKRFLLPFESGVVVVKHWLIHNMIRTDRYKPTRFLDEKNTLFLKENKAYTDDSRSGVPLLATNRQPNDNQPAPQVRLGKVSLGNTHMSDKSDDSFDRFWSSYPKKELKKKTLEIWKRKKIGAHIEEILTFIEKAKKTDRWVKGFIKQPPAFLNGECWQDDISSYAGFKTQEVGMKINKY